MKAVYAGTFERCGSGIECVYGTFCHTGSLTCQPCVFVCGSQKMYNCMEFCQAEGYNSPSTEMMLKKEIQDTVTNQPIYCEHLSSSHRFLAVFLSLAALCATIVAGVILLHRCQQKKKDFNGKEIGKSVLSITSLLCDKISSLVQRNSADIIKYKAVRLEEGKLQLINSTSLVLLEQRDDNRAIEPATNVSSASDRYQWQCESENIGDRHYHTRV